MIDVVAIAIGLLASMLNPRVVVDPMFRAPRADVPRAKVVRR